MSEEEKEILPPCPECGSPSVVHEIGSATGRRSFRCTKDDCKALFKEKNPAAVALGALGGKARAKALSADELSEQGRKAVETRWRNHKLKQNYKPS